MPDRIVSLLSSGALISGQNISRNIGVSRAAVWKKITGLRRKGYIIDAVPSRGYRLISAPDLSEEYITAKACGRLWREVHVHDIVSSTNDTAMSLAVGGGIKPGAVIIADSQKAGKGRLGRKWASPAGGNIYMSMVIRPEIDPSDITLLTILSAVAAVSAIWKSCGVRVSIKWPNDLVVGERKLGGILTEIRADQDKISLAVIGIGINVNMKSEELPEDLRHTAASLYSVSGLSHSRNSIIIDLLMEFEDAYDSLRKKGRAEILARWKDHSSTLGKRVRATMGRTSVIGTAEDIDENGMLIIRTDAGERKRISAGDITHLRPAG